MKWVLQGLLGALVAAGLLVLLFRGTEWERVASALAGMHLGWVLAAQGLLWASYFARAKRWAYVVRASHPASFRALVSATQIGFLVNFTVPARLGEIVRAYVLSRLAGPAVSRSLALVGLDRVNDLVGLLAVLLVATLALSNEAGVEIAAGTFGNREAIAISGSIVRPAGLVLAGATALGLAGLVLLYLRRQAVVRAVRSLLAALSERLAGRVAGLVESFAEGLRVFRSALDLALAVSWSLVTWALNVATLAALLLAFDVGAPWYTGFVMLALIGAFIAVPVTPGVVGQYHVAAVAGLLLCAPQVDPDRAKAVALVAHVSTLASVGLLGVACLLLEQMSFADLLRRSRRDNPPPGAPFPQASEPGSSSD